jgi:hypothetical protein
MRHGFLVHSTRGYSLLFTHNNIILGHSMACCSPGLNSASVESCFVPVLDNSSAGHCVDPVPLLTNSTIARCTHSDHCENASRNAVQTCIRPRKAENLLRLTYRTQDWDTARVLLWSGPREELLEEGKAQAIGTKY